jgi:hypothetical protein
MNDHTSLTIPDAITDVASLMDKAHSYIAASKAANTVRAYASDRQHFKNWCDTKGVSPDYAESTTLRRRS